MQSSLTPQARFKSETINPQRIPHLNMLMTAPQGHQQPQVHNNIILNLNGTTNINNFSVPPPQQPQIQQRAPQMVKKTSQQPQMNHIQGRKYDGQQGPHLRMSQEGIADPQVNQIQGQNRQPNQKQVDNPIQFQKSQAKNKMASTLLPKKLLNQAKSAKNARITPKGIIQKQVKEAALSGLDTSKHVRNTTQGIPYQSNIQTTKGPKSKSNSQFDFNFSSGLQVLPRSDKNTTIDYAKQGNNALNSAERSGPALKLTQISNQNSRRQASNSYHNLQNIMNTKAKPQSQGQSGQTKPKSSRSLNQSKQNASQTKHRRNKSEIRNSYHLQSKPVTKINTLLKQANHNTIQKVNQTQLGGDLALKSFEHNKENQNYYNLSGERNKSVQNQTAATNNPSRIAAQTVTNKSKNQEGLSISSFSSGSNKGKYNLDSKTNKQKGGSIADQLSKNYFLNSKQLLKHLSPTRDDENVTQSKQTVNKGEMNMNLSQRNQFRGRTRSTAAAPSTQVQKGSKERKTHSQSQSRSTNIQQLQTLRNKEPQLKSIIVDKQENTSNSQYESRVTKSKSAQFVQSNASKTPTQPSKTQINKMAVDKMIKQNIRNKKSQQDELFLKKQHEDDKQRQRRADLSQRNQEVRKENASKIVNKGATIADQSEILSPQENLKQDSAKDTSQRRRSQSCIDYSVKKGATATSAGSRRDQRHHSQENKQSKESQQPMQQIPSRQIGNKVIPNTVTNKGKPRQSFVHQINQLTNLIEKEIGNDQTQNNTGGRNSNRITQTNYQQKSTGITQKPDHVVNRSTQNKTAVETNSKTKLTNAYNMLLQASNNADLKKGKKGDKPSVEIQKFIERKKREELVKKSLELTIEVDKHNKIQQNLQSLDRVRKKTIRQKSVPAIASKKNSTQHVTKVQKYKGKKAKASQDAPVIGLSQIFHKEYRHSQDDAQAQKHLSSEMNTPIRYEIKFEMAASQNLEKIKIANLKKEKRNSMNTSVMANEFEALSKTQKGQKSRSGRGQYKASNVKKHSAPATVKQTKSAAKKAMANLDKTMQANVALLDNTHYQDLKKAETVSRYQKKNSTDENSLSNIQHKKSNQMFFDKSRPQVPSNSREISSNVRSSQQMQAQRSQWLANKHPNAAKNSSQRNENKLSDAEEYQNSSKRQSAQGVPKRQPVVNYDRFTPSSHNLNESSGMQYTNKADQSDKLSPKSTEQIRRIHELVALYRCRFKSSVSDAAIMGSLHSAASVIQINFRYMRHLKQTEPLQKSENNIKTQEVGLKQQILNIQELPGPNSNSSFINSVSDRNKFNKVQEMSGISKNLGKDALQNSYSDYVQTTDKRQNRDSDLKDEGVVQNTDGGDWYNSGKNSESWKAAFNQSGENIEMISQKMFLDGKTSQNIAELARGSEQTKKMGSVFHSSVQFNSEEQSASREKTERDQQNSKQQSREYQLMQPRSSQPAVTNQNYSMKKVESKHKANKSLQPPADLQPLDVEQIEEDYRASQHMYEQVAKSQLGLENQHSGKGQKTPQLPLLDLRRVGADQNVARSKNAGKSVEKQSVQEGLINKAKESPRSQSATGDQPQTASSYSGIFNRMGLPLPRSARVAVDYQILKKDPRMVNQLKEIIEIKAQKGRQVIEEGRQDNYITDRTCEVNRGKLEKWVNASYNKIEEQQKEQRSSRRQKIPDRKQLLIENVDGLARINKLMNVPEGERISARSSYRLTNPGYQNHQYPSERGAQASIGDNYIDEDPYSQNMGQPNMGQIAIGSARAAGKSELVHMINGDSSSSSKPNRDQSASESRKNMVESSSYRGPQDDEIRLDEIQTEIPNMPGRYKADHQRQYQNPLQPNNSQENLNELVPGQVNPYYQDVGKNKIKTQNLIQNINDEQLQNLMHLTYTKGANEEGTEKIEGRSRQSGSPIDSHLERDGSGQHQKTEKSLKRSQSYSAHTMPGVDYGPSIDNLNPNSEIDDSQVIDHDAIDIEFNQLENELKKQKKKQISPELPSKNNLPKNFKSPQEISLTDKKNANIQAIRDPQFFTNRVEDDSDLNRLKTKQLDQELKIQDHISVEIEANKDFNSNLDKFSGEDDQTKGQTTNLSNTILDSANKELENLNLDISTKSPQTTQKLIKVQDQQINQDSGGQDLQNEEFDQKNGQYMISVDPINVNEAGGIPVSPVSDQALGQIQTGAHSLSSTGSDVANAIQQVNRDNLGLDSPPDLVSPVSANKQVIQLFPQNAKIETANDLQQQNEELADMMTEYLYSHIMQEFHGDLDLMIPRRELTMRNRQGAIKFFEKKGVKTDLFAIEKYVDEVLEEVKGTRSEFMTEIERPLTKNSTAVLFQMQNSEIGTYEHFVQQMQPVLSLDLYLKLEKRRKESRENADPELQPDGRFDFENVTNEELKEDGVDKNFLAECQHIHNKVLFDCINDSLQQFRPHGKDGSPMMWSRLSRKLKPTEDFTLEEMFEITKHDLFRMAIMQAGTLPRREFVFSGQFDEDLFAEIREKKLATLLCREIVDNEPQWLKWDFEEAQTKIDIADMVLESLVTETIQFLQTKSTQKTEAQLKFEEIERGLKAKNNNN